MIYHANFSILVQLGGSSITTSEAQGGERFNSFNQDYALTWKPHKQWQIYGEVFGQSKTGPDEGSGYIADAGVQYLVNKYLVLDLEVGQRISGDIASIKTSSAWDLLLRFDRALKSSHAT